MWQPGWEGSLGENGYTHVYGCPPEHITTLLTGYVLSHFSCVQLFATLWTVAHQALLSMGFSRKDYWSGLSCPPSVLLQYKVKSLENERICRYRCIGILVTTQKQAQRGKMLQSTVYSEVSLPASGSGSAVSLLCDWLN